MFKQSYSIVKDCILLHLIDGHGDQTALSVCAGHEIWRIFIIPKTRQEISLFYFKGRPRTPIVLSKGDLSFSTESNK
jgi:hypothetical protein